MQPVRNLIQGELRPARCGREFNAWEPAAGTESEALAIANSTTFGLAASVWSRDVARCHRMAAQLESGLVWINTWMMRDLRVPMGGVKSSGVGREGGWEAMRFFTEPKNVCLKY